MLKSFLKIQASDNLFCCLYTGSRTLLYPPWRIQGRGPGASPPPLNFRPNGGPKGGKNFFFGDRAPPYLRVWIRHWPCSIWRSHERLYIRSLLSMRGMLLRYSFQPRPKGRVLVTLGLVMTIDQSINGCSHSEKRKQFGEREQDWPVQKYGLRSVSSKVWHDPGWASFSPPTSRRSKRISVRGVCCL